MSKEYVEERVGSFYLVGSRVPLATIVREFREGESAESIRSHYPTLTLEQVYGAIAYYLANQDRVENDLAVRRRGEEEFDSRVPKELKEKLDRARLSGTEAR